MAHSHYDNLQVSRNASEQVIRAAYRTLASKYHPDKCEVPADEAHRIMKLLNQAYAVLSDPASRKKHDEWLVQQSAKPPSPQPASSPPVPPASTSRTPSQQPASTEPVRGLRPPVWLVVVGGGAAIWAISSLPSYQSNTTSSAPYTVATPSASTTNVPVGLERCKGSYEQAKCEELERKLAAETPEERRSRQSSLEPSRKFTLAEPQRQESTTPTASLPPPQLRDSYAPNGRLWPTRPSYVSGYPVLNASGHSEVTIDNRKNDANVFAKLVSVSAVHARPVRYIYIPAGSMFTAKGVAPGDYDVRYQNLDTGSMYKTESFLLSEVRSESGVRYRSVTMTLYKVRDGNMQTSPITDEEFK